MQIINFWLQTKKFITDWGIPLILGAVIITMLFSAPYYLAGITIILIALGVLILSIFKTKLSLTAFFTILPFYPLTILAIENQIGLTETQTLLLRSLRDIFLIAILGILLIRRIQSTFQISTRIHKIALLIFILIGFSLLSWLKNDNSTFVKAFSLRENYFYFTLFFIGYFSLFSIRNIKRLAKWLILSGIVVASFGLIQAYILGPEFLKRFRDTSVLFVSASGFFGVQRVVSTFAHAPELGLYLVILSALVIWFILGEKTMKMKFLWLFPLFLFVITIIATFARSTWIAYFLMLFIIFRNPKTLKLMIPISVLAVILILVTPAYNYILVSFRGEASASYHWIVLTKSIDFILQNPLGVGLGNVGVIGNRLITDQAEFFEGFYFNLAGELSILATGIYWILITFTFYILRKIEKKINSSTGRIWARCLQGALIGWAVTGFFLPIMTSREIAYTLWFFIGATTNILKVESNG